MYLELIPINAMEELKKIVKRFAVFSYTNHVKEYKDKRGKFLVNSIRKLNPEKFVKENAEGYNTRILVTSFTLFSTLYRKVGYTKGTHKFIELLKITLKLLQVCLLTHASIKMLLTLSNLQAERDFALELLDASTFDGAFSDILEPTLDIYFISLVDYFLWLF